MINVSINDVVYNIPQDWSDVSINQWRSLRHIQTYLKEDMTEEEQLTIELEIISVFTDIPFDVLLNVPGEYYKIIVDNLSFYRTKKLKTEPRTSIEVDGVEYKLIDLTKLTLGDRANIDIIRDNGNIEDRIGRVMTILYRKEDEGDLTMEERDDKEVLFNEKVSIDDVYSTLVFFLIMIESYKKNMEFSSIVEKRDEMMKTMMKDMTKMERMKMKIKSVMDNIITAWRIGYLKGKSWILKRSSK